MDKMQEKSYSWFDRSSYQQQKSEILTVLRLDSFFTQKPGRIDDFFCFRKQVIFAHIKGFRCQLATE
jgi:hypothetical protein